MVCVPSRDDIPASQDRAAANISRDLTELSDNVNEIIEESNDNPGKGETQVYKGITNQPHFRVV